jgi:hypothetical protein
MADLGVGIRHHFLAEINSAFAKQTATLAVHLFAAVSRKKNGRNIPH